jgi:hypothetical protein
VLPLEFTWGITPKPNEATSGQATEILKIIFIKTFTLNTLGSIVTSLVPTERGRKS